jgi:WD40 repeat protein/serine/threonine protein kinase
MADLDANRNLHLGTLALQTEFDGRNASATVLPDLMRLEEGLLDEFATRAGPSLDQTRLDSRGFARSVAPASSRYQVMRSHSQGGLGRVSVALDEELNREVALKELLNHHADNPASRSRFMLEAEVTGSLEHPGIVPVYGLGQFPDGRPYYAMRFIRGGSFTAAIQRYHDASRQGRDPGDDTLEFRQLLRRFIDVCNAIEYAHSRGVLHRDLKPDNVMLGEYGETLVVDWGLAKVTGRQEPAAETAVSGSSQMLPRSATGSSATVAGIAIGTPQYMSPEQAAGQLDRLGPASDVYSLGATLYFLLTGGPPIRDLNLEETLRCVELGDFPRPRQRSTAIPASLEAVCLKAMSLDPALRYPSARALADELEHWLADEPVMACRESWSTRLVRFARRHRVWTQAMAAALFSIVIVSTFAVYVTHQQRRVAERLARENASLATTETALRKTAEKQAAFLAFERSYAECLRADAAQGMNALALCLREASRVDALDAETSIRLQLAGWTRYIQPLRMVMRHDNGRVTCVAFSPDARQIVMGDDEGMVQRWSLETSDPIGQPIRHDKPISAVAFDDSGKNLLTASLDKTVCLRDADSGVELRSRLLHPESVTCAAFSPDGQIIVTGSTDSNGRIWDARTATTIGQLLTHDGCVSSVAFSPDGKRIATGSHDKTARIWDAATGLPVGPVIMHAEQVHAVAFDPSGKLIVTGTGNAEERSGVAQFWNARTGRAVGSPLVHQDTVQTLAISPDGKTLLTGSNDCMARLWDLTARRTLGSPLMHNGKVTGVAFSRDGSRILTGSGAGPVRVWDARMDRDGFPPLDHAGTVNSITFSPDGKYLLTASEDGTTRLWDTGIASRTTAGGTSGATPWEVIREWPGSVATISADGRTVVTGNKNHTARRWDLASGEPIGAPLQHGDAVCALELSPDGQYLLTHTADDTSHLWQIEAGPDGKTALVRRWACRTAVFSPDGTTILTGGDDGSAHVQNTSTGRVIAAPLLQQKAVVAVAFNPDGKTVLTGSADGTARLWDLSTGKLVGRPMFHRHRVAAVTFSPDGKTILTGSEDNTARLWEASTLLQIGPPIKHHGSVRAVAFNPDGRTMLTGGVDRSVQFWDVPVALAGDVERIILWTQVVTGLSLEDDGVLNVLNARAWGKRSQQLAELPGPALP